MTFTPAAASSNKVITEPLLSHCINQVLRAASKPLTLRQITVRVNRMLPKARRVTVQQIKAVLDAAASGE